MIVSNLTTLVTCNGLTVGEAGLFSQLRIGDSARVVCTSVTIGSLPARSSSAVVVGGEDALLRVRGSLAFGPAPGTFLEMDDGGLVLCSSYTQGPQHALLGSIGGTNRRGIGRMKVTTSAVFNGELRVARDKQVDPTQFPQPYRTAPPVTDLGDVDWVHEDEKSKRRREQAVSCRRRHLWGVQATESADSLVERGRVIRTARACSAPRSRVVKSLCNSETRVYSDRGAGSHGRRAGESRQGRKTATVA